MKKRFAVGLALAIVATTAPSLLRAQAPMPLIGGFVYGTESSQKRGIEAFRAGLREAGYVEGKNCRIEMRFADNRADRLPGLARELLALKPAVVVAWPVRAAQALNRESKTIPIVMGGGAGAQSLGLIASLARPGGNVTGLTNLGDALTAKHFELLREVAPRAKRVVALSSGLGAVEAEIRTDSRAGAERFGMTLIEALADSPGKLPELEARCKREHCDALVVLLDPSTFGFRREIAALAARLRIPSLAPGAAYAADGVLISYSADQWELLRSSAGYVDRILRGAKPGDLPVAQPTRFELVINRKTAKAIGMTIPQSLLLRADRVIE
ncbi:MAG: ABC transporter substrate-binding protein [Burkholderiales bacterium]|nr:ABC transporter substrate-binding protein [Burkholderiales bacterium]